MSVSLSAQGKVMSQLSGVRAIMKDIVETLERADKKYINLAPGNPVVLPEVEQLWRDCTHELLASKSFAEVVGRYGSSRGYEPFIDAVIGDFNVRYGLKLTRENVLVTAGSQSLYFYAANCFGGVDATGQLKKVLFPLSPDYTGYGGVSLSPDSLLAVKPNLEISPAEHRFKYRPDIDSIEIDENVGCVVFSRPCNPTGNIVTEEEVKSIAAKALLHKVPVLVDSAYGPPFPALNFTEMTPVFDEGIIHCMSFSKTGLPGERIGVAIGAPEVIQALECFHTNASLHSSRYGQAIAALAVGSGRLADIATTVIRGHYAEKLQVVETTLDSEVDDSIPWYMHKGEGAIFAWLWFDNLPISDWDLYQSLKNEGLIVVPGSPFFPGLREEWAHRHQCIRVSLTASKEELQTGMKILAKRLKEIYSAT
jgi:valine--pyruvate aminotransferase